MAYSSVQGIRQEAGLQNKYNRFAMTSTGDSTVWNVNTDDPFKIVVNDESGGTSPTTSDVVVEMNGSSVGVSAISQATGDVTIASGTTAGGCVIATFASSPVSDDRVYDSMQEAYSIVNGYIAKEYELPLSVTVPMLTDLERKLGAGNLLKSSYGVSAEDLAEDGYRLQQDAMDILDKISKGEIDLVDGSGNPVDKIEDAGNEEDMSEANSRTQGVLFISEQEEFTVEDLDDWRP